MSTAGIRVIPRFGVMCGDGEHWHETGGLRTFCGLAMIPGDEVDAPTFLTYPEAAKRVGRNERSIRKWHHDGMPMEWRTDDAGQKFRVVEEQVLLKWYQERLKGSPTHFYRMRRAAVERGETPPALPARFRREPKRAPEQAQNAIQHAPQPSQVPEEGERPEHHPDAFLRVLAELPVFHGQREHAALMQAMADEPPACDGLEVFTRDRFDDPEELEMMRGICRDCPLIDYCRAFAAAGKPTAGMWAGKTPAEIRRLDGGSLQVA